MINPLRARRTSIEKDDYNPGFEQFSGSWESKKKKPKASIEKQESTLAKLVSSKKSDFQNKWSFLIFTVNLYNLFTVPYFLGIKGFPWSIWLALEIIFEMALLVDIISRLIFRKSKTWQRMWMLHEKEMLLVTLSLCLSSVPFSFLALIFGMNLNSYIIAGLRSFKLLRLFQLSTFFSNQEIIANAPQGYFMRICKNLILLLGTLHYCGMLLLFVARVEIDCGNHGTWLQPWIDGGAANYEIYTDAVFWATATLSTIAYNDTTPFTLAEKYASSLIMVVGASMCAWISGNIVFILITLNLKEFEAQEKLERVKKWCKLRELNPRLRKRVLAYYWSIRSRFSYLIDVDFLEDLPSSLKNEISAAMHEDMIPKIKLFSSARPGFVLAMTDCLKLKIFMKGDYIIRQADVADDFFFIKTGVVEVIAADSDIVIAYLHEGDYFGEIGILLNILRTLSVKAFTASMISSISKQDLCKILNEYPEYHDYLMKVARQRLETTKVEDLDFGAENQEEDQSPVSPRKSRFEEEIKIQKISWKERDWFEWFFFARKNDRFEGFLIDAFSPCFYFWSLLLYLSYSFYLFYIPFAIAFQYPADGIWLPVDIIAYIVYFFDIPIHLYTSICTELGTYLDDIPSIRKHYINKFLWWDLVSLVPIDFICAALGSAQYVSAFFRILRLFKAKRIFKLSQSFLSHSHASLSYSRILLLFIVTIYYSHFIACISYYLGKLQYWINPDARFNNQNFINQFPLNNYYEAGKDILDIPIYDQYVNLLYFGYSISTSGAYGDVPIPTVPEKVLNIIFMVFSMILAAFIIGEAASYASNHFKTYTEHTKKLRTVKNWMNHSKLSKELRNRVLDYYDLLWCKLQGCDDEEIMMDFPETLRTDIKYYLFTDLIKSGFFPEEERGAILAIVKKFKLLMACKDEQIIAEGELGLQMYFILDGEVEIISFGIVLNTLAKGTVFGEMALLSDYSSARRATVKAKTDVTIAVLSKHDFNFVMETYPEFSTKVRKLANEREAMSRMIIQNKKSMEFPNNLKDEEVAVSNLKEEAKSELAENETMMTSRETQNFPASEIIVKRLNISLSFLKLYSSPAKHYIYLILNLYNFIFTPLQIAFEYEYSPPLMLLEILSIILYIVNSVYYWELYRALISLPTLVKEKRFQFSSPSKAFNKFIHNLILAIPFALIFKSCELREPRELICIFSTIRITCFYNIAGFFFYIKKMHFKIFTFLRVIEVAAVYIMFNHFCGSYFIECAKREDVMHSWLSRVPSPQPEQYRTNSSEPLTRDTVYTHAFHWSSIVVSHAGYGWVVSNSPSEKAYNCFVFLIGLFAFSILFGSITSLVAELSSSDPKFTFEYSYKYVKDFVNKKLMDDFFMEKINDYFDYLWRSNKGIYDENILNELPPSLMSDIQFFRYSKAVRNAQIFKNKDGSINEPLAKSILRLLKVEIYLAGDPILDAGEKRNDFFIVLDGEAHVINFKGKKIVEVLYPGNHFGEIPTMVDLIKSSPFYVVAAKISKIGILEEQYIKDLREAYPEWYNNMSDLAQEKLINAFSSGTLEEAIDCFDTINSNIHDFPETSKKYYANIQKLLEIIISEERLKPSSNVWYSITSLYIFFLTYTLFELPLEIGFEMEYNWILFTLEMICLLVSASFILINFKNYIFSSEKDQIYKESFFCFALDLFSLSPFNIIFASLQIEEPIVLIVLLRLLRLIATFRLLTLFAKIKNKLRQFSAQLNILETMICVLALIHFMSCSFFYYSLNEKYSSWVKDNSLQDSEIGNQYSWALFHVLNILTCTGYGGFMLEANDSERIWTVFLILIGDVMSAIIFGLMATAVATPQSDLKYYIEKLKSPMYIASSSEKINGLIKKLESYHAFTISLDVVYGSVDYRNLFLYLPRNISKSIIFECSRSILEEVPYFQFEDSRKLFEQISIYLKPKIFLPKDYIIHKEKSCDEIFFIIEGSIALISANGKIILKTLRKGSLIGDLEFLTSVKSTFSVIAKSMCYTYSLDKKDLIKSFEKYPDVYEEIQKRIVKHDGLPIDIANQDSANDDELIKLRSADLRNALEIKTGTPEFDSKGRRRESLNSKRRKNIIARADSDMEVRKQSIARSLPERRYSKEYASSLDLSFKGTAANQVN